MLRYDDLVQTFYFLCVLGAIGVMVIVVLGFGDALTRWWRRHWQHTEGKVVGDPEVQEHVNEESVSYTVEWRYEFSVDGFPFFGRMRVSQEDMDYVESFIFAMRSGTPVRVWYDPKDPSRSDGTVLESDLLRITPR
jgi:hypothetical protein